MNALLRVIFWSAAMLMLVVASALPTTASADPGSKKLDFVFFGDSLSDTGNRFFDEGAMNTPPYDMAAAENLIPSWPYAIGGPTYTNGKVWVEFVAQALGRSGAAQAALRSNGIAANYAYSGARASNALPLPPNSNRHLGDQVVQYIADRGAGNISPDAIHVIFIGGNDIAQALFLADALQDPSVVVPIIQNAIESVFQNSMLLASAGAKRFLLLTAPTAGYVPAFGGDPVAIFFSEQITGAFNCAVAGMNANSDCSAYGVSIAAALTATGLDVQVFDMNALFKDLIYNPENYGLTNTTDHCIQPFVPPFQCDNPDEYLFWDNAHPTGNVHEMIGNAVVDALAN